MPITIQIKRRALEHFTPSGYCEWCVKVTTDDDDGFVGPEGERVPLQWALDFAPDTDILDPAQADLIEGAPKYTIDPEPGEGTITQPDKKEFEICFVAACKDRKDTEMSLEHRIDFPRDALLAPRRDWHRVPFKDAPNGVRKILGPAPVAMSHPPRNESEVIARFEAQKLTALLGLPNRPVHEREPESLAVVRPRLYVSGAPRGET